MRKLVVLGLDGFNPELVKAWSDELPALMEFQDEGIWGNMESTVPPEALPAWLCAQTGRNPGYCGVWGPTFRKNFGYHSLEPVDSNIFGPPKEVNYRRDERDPLFRLLYKRGLKVAIINTPGSWPPPRVTGGYCISRHSAPAPEQDFTWPPSLAKELQDLVGDYLFDIPDADFEKMDLDAALEKIRSIDEQRLTILKHFIANKQCDYIFTVLTGCDLSARLLYRYMDETHRHYEKSEKYGEALKDYYRFIDEELGEIRDTIDNETVLMVHSTSSVQKLDGRIHLNEVLIEKGFLVLKKYPSKISPFENLKVDWSKTRAWAMGPTGQVYLNVKGRETKGIVAEADYDGVLSELSAALETLEDEKGNKMKVDITRRDQIHHGPGAEYGPDLFVRFEEGLRDTDPAVGSKEIHGSQYRPGYDDTTNGANGYFCVVGRNVPEEGEKQGVSVMDVAPTVYSIVGEEIPGFMEGKPFVKLDISQEELEEIAMQERLTWLGY